MKCRVRYSTMFAALLFAALLALSVAVLPAQSIASSLKADEGELVEATVVQVIPNRENRALSESVSDDDTFSLADWIAKKFNQYSFKQAQDQNQFEIELSSYELAESELIVFDASDETTPVIAPVVGQVLTAQIEASVEATEELVANLDFFEQLEFAQTSLQEIDAIFNWHYADTPEESLSAETTFMVSSDSIGQILALTVTIEKEEAAEEAVEAPAAEEGYEVESEDIVLTWTAEEPVRILFDLDALTVLESTKVFGECDTAIYPPINEDLLTDWPYLVDPADFEIEVWRAEGTLAGSYNIYAQLDYDGDTYKIIPQENDDYTVVGENKFQIKPRPITVTAASDSKVYDGTALTNPAWTLSEESLLSEHTITVVITGSQTSVGESKNIVESVIITKEVEGVESDLSSNYEFSFVAGTLTVTPAATDTAPPPEGGTGGSGTGSTGGGSGGSGAGTTGGSGGNDRGIPTRIPTPTLTPAPTPSPEGTPGAATTPGPAAATTAATTEAADEDDSATEDEEVAEAEEITAPETTGNDVQREPRAPAEQTGTIDASEPFDWSRLSSVVAVILLIGLAVAIFFLARKLDLFGNSSS